MGQRPNQSLTLSECWTECEWPCILLKSLGNLRRPEVMTNIRTCLKYQYKSSSGSMKMGWKMKQDGHSGRGIYTHCLFLSFAKQCINVGENEQSHWAAPRSEEIRQGHQENGFHRREQRVVRDEFMECLRAKCLYSQSSF